MVDNFHSADSTRSPMDNLYKMLSGLSAGHDKALKQGIYNAVALFLLCLVAGAGYGLYIVLSPFLKPLVWALLCGSVLFPFKYSLATTVHSWFDNIQRSHKLLFINLMLLPLQIIDKSAEALGSFLWRHVKYIGISLTAGSVLFGAYRYTPNVLTCLTWRIFMSFAAIAGFFITTCNIYTVTAVCIGYITILYVYWTPENSSGFHYMSFMLWFIISLYFSNLTGGCRLIVFVTLQTLYIIGFIYEIILIMGNEEAQGRHVTFMEAVSLALTNKSESQGTEEEVAPQEGEHVEPVEMGIESQSEVTDAARASHTNLEKKDISLDTSMGFSPASAATRKSRNQHNWHMACTAVMQHRYLLRRLKTELRLSLDIEDQKVDTDKYMYGALYSCVGMLLWKHKWIIHILVIPLAYYVVKRFGSYFGFWDIIYSRYRALVKAVQGWCSQRQQALLPANIRGLYKVGIVADEKLTDCLKASVDAVATTAVILGLVVFSVCASIFITVQVYSEGMHLVQVTSEIVNSSVLNNPDIDWVPGEWQDSVNSVLDNAYTYGRSAISDGIKGLMKDLEPNKADQMEKKVLELWDRFYQAWMMSSENPDMIGPTVDVDAAYSVWESFKDSFGKMPLQLFNMTNIQNFAKENVGILTSVLDSLWSIVKGNISVILTIFTELFYIVLMSGSAVLNFVLSMVVFFTTLFYLLNSSGKTYKPVELTTMLSPISCHSAQRGHGFAIALQEAVIGVFAATFKLASFFGMWTWFIHNMFQVKIVYLPSAFATILGAIPFLDAYFACIPATLELYFTRDLMTASLFFLFHFLPCNIVVTEFYKEIKGGGHPYLTGLSIAGGIFCLGVEGAIFGPLLLCCIMVVINLCRRYLHSPSEDVLNSYSRMAN